MPQIFGLFQELADKETGLQYLETVLRYLSVTAEQVTPEDLREAVETAFHGRGGEMMSTLAQQWLEQGRQEGWQKGRQEGWQKGVQQAIRQNILELLDIRLGAAPAAIAERLESVEAPETLRLLLRRAATVDTLAEFEQALETLIP